MNHLKPLALGGEGQALIERHEGQGVGPILRRRSRGGQLERIGRSQAVGAEQPHGNRPQARNRLNLTPREGERVQSIQGVQQVRSRYRRLAFKTREGTTAFNSGRPPYGQLRVCLEYGPDC